MADLEPIRFSCDCGSVRGHIARSSKPGGTHVVCHCKHCRAAALWSGAPDPDPDGVGVFQTSADRVRFTEGQDKVTAIRLTPKGPFRWIASCCSAPLFNTASDPGVPFAGLIAARADDPAMLGKVRMHIFRPQPDGSSKWGGSPAVIVSMLTGLAAVRLSGRWKDTPLFDAATRKPLATPRLLTKDERATLYPPRAY
ncbi:DUF6151 family protein [Chachezhania antarctica]|uniref:DUF6151 family protein n=1 Tax=Chachezhania antarctica TaxID=2340860 RepID=UPI000EB1B85B|nr:DUF6151 family protein [Chachezhania antarctica]|tara:strand:- start:2270 stop:2860 length:591 start_codon:yes stop_codon:yes gene_type:complete